MIYHHLGLKHELQTENHSASLDRIHLEEDSQKTCVVYTYVYIYVYTYIPKSPSAFGVGDVCPNVAQDDFRLHHKSISLDHKSKRQNIFQKSSQKKTLQSHLHLLVNEQKPTTTNTNLSFPNKKNTSSTTSKKPVSLFLASKNKAGFGYGVFGEHCWYL